jgi:hypothetical protein
MAHALNLFVPIRQDADSLKLLAEIEANFATRDQALIEKAARDSQILHFLRVLISPDRKYFVVLTEYDGSHEEYAEFFRLNLPDLFKQIFTLANGPEAWDQVNNERAFYEASKSLQIRSLGNSVYDEKDPFGKTEGYLFHAYGPRTVKQILPLLK